MAFVDQDPASRVLTLIANPLTRPLDRNDAESAATALAHAGAAVGPLDWLAEDAACDIPFAGIDLAVAEEAGRAALNGLPFDIVALNASGRRKAGLVADMDSTIVTGETLDEMAAAVGLKDRIAEITARAMNGELDFAEALRERVSMLTDLPLAAVQRTLEHVELSPGARTLVATMRAHGALCALVSGGFTVIAEPVARMCGFDRVVANRLDIVEDRLTGRVAEPIVGADAKLATLERLAAEREMAPRDICAVGDGANDLPMLLAAGLGVAYRAKPAVRARAQVRLDHADLSALLYLQGYRRDAFVA